MMFVKISIILNILVGIYCLFFDNSPILGMGAIIIAMLIPSFSKQMKRWEKELDDKYKKEEQDEIN